MRERAGFLNLITELRGRLDELERLVRTAPNHSIISPVSYDEDGVVDLTPPGYTAFRAKGLEGAATVARYAPFADFVQFGVPDLTATVEATSFDLSDLHRTGPDPAFGLRLIPAHSENQPWFTYELLLAIANPTDFVWLEFVAKLSFDQPLQSFVQFIIDGDGFSERIDVGVSPVSDFATFKHIRLDRAALMTASAGRAVQRIRLTFATGGMPIPLTIYGMSVFGRAVS